MKLQTVATVVVVLQRLLKKARSRQQKPDPNNGVDDGAFYDIPLEPPPPPVPQEVLASYDIVEADGRRGMFYDTQGQYSRVRERGIGKRWGKLMDKTRDFFR